MIVVRSPQRVVSLPVHAPPPSLDRTAPSGYAASATSGGGWRLEVPAVARDGDSFEAAGLRFRLHGVDAPELAEPGGAGARARLQQLLELRPLAVFPVAVDRYGRIVASVIAGSVDVAAALRAEGHAKEH